MDHVKLSGGHEEKLQTVVIRQFGIDFLYIGIAAHRSDVDEILVPLHIELRLFLRQTAIVGQLQTGKDGCIVPFRRRHHAVDYRRFGGSGNLQKITRGQCCGRCTQQRKKKVFFHSVFLIFMLYFARDDNVS